MDFFGLFLQYDIVSLNFDLIFFIRFDYKFKKLCHSITMVPDKQLPKHLLINLDDENSEQQSDINQVQPTQYRAPQRIQINSLQALRSNIIQTSPPKIKQNSVSPAKKQAFILKQRVLKNEIIIGDVESTSQIKSSTSMNTSTMNFMGGKLLGKQLDEFQEEIESCQKSQSPQKLRKGAKSQFQSLLRPSQDIQFRCNQYLNKIYNSLTQQPNTLQQIQQFLHTPLPQLEDSYMRYVFQIHFYKYTFTFHSYYEFYLRNSAGEMLHLLKSEKDSLTVSSSHMLYACRAKDQQFTAKLKYNTVKSEYNLYDVDEKENPHLTRKFLASLFYEKALGEDRELKLYVPKLEFVNNDFVKSQGKKNLAAFYDQNQAYFNRKVEVLKTVQIPKDKEQTVRQEFQLKNEGRRILLQNEEGQEKFYMGKRQDQRYIILASCGLTPLQVFATAVTNLDH